MRVIVNRTLCESNAVCARLVPEVFVVDDDDRLQIKQEQPPPALRERVEHAVRTQETREQRRARRAGMAGRGRGCGLRGAGTRLEGGASTEGGCWGGGGGRCRRGAGCAGCGGAGSRRAGKGEQRRAEEVWLR